MKFNQFVQYLEKLEATSKRLEMFEILSELFKHIDKKEADKVVYFCEGQLLPPFYGLELNMAASIASKAIAEAAKNKKEEVDSAAKKIGDFGLVAEKLFENKKSKGVSITEVYDCLTHMAKTGGEGSVDKKVTLLAELLEKCDAKEAKYIIRFVMGRLRLGIGDPTIMDSMSKAISGDRMKLREDIERAYNLCSDLGLVAATLFEKGENGLKGFKAKVGMPIRMAAAERLPTTKEIIEKLGKCAVESKYDGFRLQVHKDGDKVEIFSRNQERMTHMFPDVAEGIRKQLGAKKAIVEGEALAYNEETGEIFPFQVTITRKRKHGIAELSKDLPLVIFLFDILYLDGEDITGLGYEERRKTIERILKKGREVRISNRIVTDDPKEMEKFFEDEISKGLEGVMAKRLDAPYEAGKRGFNWIKLKRSYKGQLEDTIDVVLIGYFRGRGMRAEFGIGAVLGAVYDEKKDMFTTIARIGSGISEEEWVALRKLLDEEKVTKKPARVETLIEPDVWSTPKYVFTVLADEITQSPMHTAGKVGDGPGFALRFPRIQGWIREDKKPEDSTTAKEVKEMFDHQRKVKSKNFGN